MACQKANREERKYRVRAFSNLAESELVAHTTESAYHRVIFAKTYEKQFGRFDKKMILALAHVTCQHTRFRTVRKGSENILSTTWSSRNSFSAHHAVDEGGGGECGGGQVVSSRRKRVTKAVKTRPPSNEAVSASLPIHAARERKKYDGRPSHKGGGRCHITQRGAFSLL